MQVAPLERDTRRRNVDSFSLQTLLLFTRRDLFGPGVEGCFDLTRGEVGGPADLLALSGVKRVAYALLYIRKLRGRREIVRGRLRDLR